MDFRINALCSGLYLHNIPSRRAGHLVTVPPRSAVAADRCCRDLSARQLELHLLSHSLAVPENADTGTPRCQSVCSAPPNVLPFGTSFLFECLRCCPTMENVSFVGQAGAAVHHSQLPAGKQNTAGPRGGYQLDACCRSLGTCLLLLLLKSSGFRIRYPEYRHSCPVISRSSRQQ